MVNLWAENVLPNGDETDSLSLGSLEETVCGLWTKEKDDFDDCQIHEENVAMLDMFRFEEDNGIADIRKRISNEGQVTACSGDSADFGGRAKLEYQGDKEENEENGSGFPRIGRGYRTEKVDSKERRDVFPGENIEIQRQEGSDGKKETEEGCENQ